MVSGEVNLVFHGCSYPSLLLSMGVNLNVRRVTFYGEVYTYSKSLYKLNIAQCDKLKYKYVYIFELYVPSSNVIKKNNNNTIDKKND